MTQSNATFMQGRNLTSLHYEDNTSLFNYETLVSRKIPSSTKNK